MRIVHLDANPGGFLTHANRDVAPRVNLSAFEIKFGRIFSHISRRPRSVPRSVGSRQSGRSRLVSLRTEHAGDLRANAEMSRGAMWLEGGGFETREVQECIHQLSNRNALSCANSNRTRWRTPRTSIAVGQAVLERAQHQRERRSKLMAHIAENCVFSRSSSRVCSYIRSHSALASEIADWSPTPLSHERRSPPPFARLAHAAVRRLLPLSPSMLQPNKLRDVFDAVDNVSEAYRRPRTPES